jgi:hypothetical protein
VTSAFRKELLPPPKIFYERELGTLSRPRRGWAMGRCPFHKTKSGKSFSVNLESGGFHCFGCDVHGGDVLAFVRLRDGLSFKQAAQYFGAWDGAPNPETVRQLHARDQERRRQRELAEVEQRSRHQRVIRLRDRLHEAGRDYWETAKRLSELRQGAAPDWPNEQEACWSHLSVTLEDLRELEQCYCAAAGLEYHGG